MAGKRPYYIISFIRECDGFDSYIIYLGVNWKAAYSRYLSAIDYIKEREFLDYGANEDELNIDIQRAQAPLEIGRYIRAYLNNDDNCWVTVELRCVNTHHFLDQYFENKYKNQFPDSKY